MQGAYQARLIAVLGEAARTAGTGRICLSAAAGEAGGCLLLHGGWVSQLLPPSGRDAPAGGVGALRQEVSYLARLLSVERAEPRFTADAAVPPAARAEGALSAADLALELSRQIAEPDVIRTLLGWPVEMRPSPPATPPRVRPRLQLESPEARLLSRADGRTTLKELVAGAGDELPALQALLALKAVGLLTASPAIRAAGEVSRPAPSRPAAAPSEPGRLASLDQFLQKTAAGRQPPVAPQGESGTTAEQAREKAELEERIRSVRGLDHYGILGVDKAAGEAQVRQAYYKLARRYHPDRLQKPHLEAIHRDLETMFAAITEAYNTLSNPQLRSEYERELLERAAGRAKDKVDRHVVARDSFLRGRREMEAGHTFEALRLFETAVENDPGRAEYHHFLGVCQGQNPRWRKKAEETLLKAIQMNPTSSQSYLELARIYRKGGLERRSHELYEEVLKWEPGNEEALSTLGRQAKNPGAGVLRSLFKKE